VHLRRTKTTKNRGAIIKRKRFERHRGLRANYAPKRVAIFSNPFPRGGATLPPPRVELDRNFGTRQTSAIGKFERLIVASCHGIAMEVYTVVEIRDDFGDGEVRTSVPIHRARGYLKKRPTNRSFYSSVEWLLKKKVRIIRRLIRIHYTIYVRVRAIIRKRIRKMYDGFSIRT